MALGWREVIFLRYWAANKPLGRTMLLGRQELHLHLGVCASTMDMAFESWRRIEHGTYAEGFLKRELGASEVLSLDLSDYEGAEIQADLGAPLPKKLANESFDTIIDGGTCEHVFDIAQCLKNLVALLQPGGQIIHFSPANQWSGHGFWQFSPETFFQFYSKENGFAEPAIAGMEASDINSFYWITKTRGNQRSDWRSWSPLTLCVRTVRVGNGKPSARIVQTDYDAHWALRVDIGGATQTFRLAGHRQAPKALRVVAESVLPDSWFEFFRQAYHYLLQRHRTRATRKPIGDLVRTCR